jgi:hypothetical protein
MPRNSAVDSGGESNAPFLAQPSVESQPAVRLCQPCWIGPEAQAPVAKSAYPYWLKLLQTDRQGSIYLHPDLLLSQQVIPGRPPVVYAHWDSQQAAPRIDSLAALADKHVGRWFLPPILARLLPLRGRYLVGNQLLGANNDEALLAFTAALEKMFAAGEEDFLLVEELEQGSPLWDALVRAGQGSQLAFFIPSPPQPHWWIDFPVDAEAYWNKFSPKTRNTLRRNVRKFPSELMCYTAEADVPRFLEAAHQVSKNTWQAKRLGLRIRNTPEERSFLEILAALGTWRSYILEYDHQPVAFIWGLQWKGCYVYEEVGFDANYAGHSPGTVLLTKVVDDLLARDPPRCLDFGGGDAEYKQKFGNRQTMSGSFLLVRRHWRPLLALRLELLRRWTARSARAGLKWLNVWRYFRQAYRK